MSDERRKQTFRKLAAKAKVAADLADRNRDAREAILKDLFPKQRTFVEDPDRRKSVLTPRRAGKTHVAIAYSILRALDIPGSTVVIVTLTLKSAKRLYWDPIRKFSERYGLGIELKEGKSEAWFPNGSKIYLNGAEDRKAIEKLRGGAYHLVVIDECKSFDPTVFRELVDDILRPATNDTSGTICLIGTPGETEDGPFWEATCPGIMDETGKPYTKTYGAPEAYWIEHPDELPRWSRHTWTAQDNIHAPWVWKNNLEDKTREGWADDNPTWLRESLGQWISTGETTVYSLATLVRIDGGPALCRAVWRRGQGQGYNKWGLPDDGSDDWRFIMGMDLGFNDDFALVVVAYSPYRNILYHVYDFRADHLIVPQIASIIQRVVERFDNRIEAMVADTGNLAKMVVETLNAQHGLFIEPAEKTEKLDHIELLNSDLYDSKLRILHGSDLYEEMLKLQWDFRGLDRRKAIRLGRLRESPNQPNHLCDALLYTWRFSLHHFSIIKAPIKDPNSEPYYMELDDQDYFEAVERKMTEARATDDDWSVVLWDTNEGKFQYE